MQAQTLDVAPAVANATAPQPLQFLRFTCGGQPCAVRIDAVREILEVGQLTPLPLVPEFVSGAMNLRGAVVPVFDLGARLGLPPIQLARRSCIVVVDVAEATADDAEACGQVQTLGLLVDAVQEVFDCMAHELEPVPRLGTRVVPGFLRSMVRTRGQATPELDLAAALDLEQLSQLVGNHLGRH